MSCYHPFAGVPDEREGRNISGSWNKYILAGPYNGPDCWSEIIKIPCGKCIGCRLDYARQWADRMMLEMDHSKVAIFVTLTYNNDNVPVIVDDYDTPLGISLFKPDLQDFIKRLRSRKKYENREIRFYADGEYGSKTRRPHYHAIIFGLSIEDFTDRRKLGCNELGQYYYTSEEFTNIWSKGFTVISGVSYKTFGYVARYVMKKAYADDVQYWQQPEFSLMSRRPGIGAYYFQDHMDCVDLSSIYLSSPDGSVKVGVPKYFMSKLKEIDEEKYMELMKEKKVFCRDRDLLKLQKTDLEYIDMLEIEENKFLDKVDILRKIRK